MTKQRSSAISSSTTNLTPPAADEVEVSIFGPGFGECIVVHLGAGRWMIVDSCVREGTSTPVALEYLESLGVDVETDVRLIVATHWHDDHVRGLSQIVSAAPTARFVCSAALQHDDFFALVTAGTTRALMTNSGVDEFGEIFRVLRSRGSKQNAGHVFALVERRLYLDAGPPPAEVWSLTPSDSAFEAAIAELGRLLPEPRIPKRRVAPVGPNHASVVLSISAGELSVTLGADLQETPGRHWTGVLESTTRPSTKSAIFKVPHHGSDNAHHDGVWSDLLTEDPVALLTPFVRGNVALPTDADRQRICGLTSEAYITAPPRRPGPARRDSAVERTIREVVRELRRAVGPMGHVRVRANTNSTQPAMAVELDPPAYDLCAQG